MELFEKLIDSVKLPVKNGPGWTIYSPETFTMESSELRVVNLQLKISIPEGFIGLLVGRIGPLTRGIDPLEFLQNDPNDTIKHIGPYLSGSKEVSILIKNLNGMIMTIEKDKPICHLVIVKCL